MTRQACLGMGMTSVKDAMHLLESFEEFVLSDFGSVVVCSWVVPRW